MDKPFHLLLTAIAAASVLTGCASTAPAASTLAMTAAPGPAASVPDGEKSVAVLAAEAGYLPATRIGAQVYCKRELMTGSRTRSTETCLTEAQIERQRQGVQTLMRGVQEMSDGGKPGNSTDGSGGRYNSAITP